MAYDVQLDSSGDLPVQTRHITGLDLIRQRAETRLRTWRGEWILDPSTGLPYAQWFERKPVPVDEMAAKVRADFVDIPGVIRVEQWQGSFAPSTRTIAITGRLITESGTVYVVVRVPGPGAENTHPAVTFSGGSYVIGGR